MNGSLDVALMKKLDGTLGHSVHFTLVNTGEHVGIFVHMLESVPIILFERVELVVVVVELELLVLILFLQFGQQLVVLLLGLSFTDSNQILLLPLEFIGITKNQAQRFLTNIPFVNGLLVEHHHTLLRHPHIANAGTHFQLLQSKRERTVRLVTHHTIGGRDGLDVHTAHRGTGMLTVISIGHPSLGDVLCHHRQRTDDKYQKGCYSFHIRFDVVCYR